jgi:hypothetical protein
MNRRKFFKSLVIGVTAVVVAPKLLVSKKSPELRMYSCNGVKITLAHNPILDEPNIIGYNTGRGTLWIHKGEWDSINSWYKTQEQIMFEQMQKYLTK